MKQLIAFLAALLIASCASIQNNEASSPVDAFKAYQAETTKENITEKAHQYFSESLLKGKDLADPSIQSQLLFKDYMAVEEQKIYQTIKGSSACLTVNGYDKERLPVTFNLAYLKTNNTWLIVEIAVVLRESDSEFEIDGKCPA